MDAKNSIFPVSFAFVFAAIISVIAAQSCEVSYINEMQRKALLRSDKLCEMCWGNNDKCVMIREKMKEYYQGPGQFASDKMQIGWMTELLSSIPPCHATTTFDHNGIKIVVRQGQQIACNVGASAATIACGVGSFFLPFPFNLISGGACAASGAGLLTSCNVDD